VSTPPLYSGTITASSSFPGGATVSWTANEDNGLTAGYSVYRSSDGQTWTMVSHDQTATSFHDSGLTAGGTYVYTIVPVNASDEGLAPKDEPESNWVVAPLEDGLPSGWRSIAAPDQSSLYYYTDSMVYWGSQQGATGYIIYKSTDGGNHFTTLTSVAYNVNSYFDSAGTSSDVYVVVSNYGAVGSTNPTPPADSTVNSFTYGSASNYYTNSSLGSIDYGCLDANNDIWTNDNDTSGVYKVTYTNGSYSGVSHYSTGDANQQIFCLDNGYTITNSTTPVAVNQSTGAVTKLTGISGYSPASGSMAGYPGSTVLYYSKSGTIYTYDIATGTGASWLAGTGLTITGMVFTMDHTLWVLTSNGDIYSISQNKVVTKMYTSGASGTWGPWTSIPVLLTDAAGNLYAQSSGTVYKVLYGSAAGAAATSLGSFGGNANVAVGRDGKLYHFSYNNSQVTVKVAS